MDAAKVLIDDHDNYASSVHCSYYGCFQFIKYKLNSLGYTYTKIDEEIGASTLLTSHGYPLDLICRRITEKLNDSGVKATEIKNKVKRLKTFRVLSDYHNENVDITKGKEAFALSEEIIKFVKSI